MKTFLRITLAIFLSVRIVAFASAMEEPVEQAHTKVDLIFPNSTIKPGETFWLGVRFRMDEHWHIYWKNPGDSGLSPTIKWDLPEGFVAGEIRWPYPERIVVPPLTTYGYEHEVVLFTSIKNLNTVEVREAVFKARVDWLACQIGCIPGRAELKMNLPLRQRDDLDRLEFKKIYAETRKRWPIDSDEIRVQAYERKDNILLAISPKSTIRTEDQIYFFPDRSDVIDHAAAQILSQDEEKYWLTINKSSLQSQPLSQVTGSVFNSSGWRNRQASKAILIHADVKNIEFSPLHSTAGSGQAPLSVPRSFAALLVACLCALLGGLILNLMPCVLPVLSLKILHLLGHSYSQKQSFRHGLSFACGIILSFWILALILLLLRSLGVALGWGFQFQSPGFVVAIGLILFLFALNLFGVFEIGTSLTTIEMSNSKKQNYSGSFWSGVLATIVATPCTAPFMGTALTFALSRNAAEALLVFTFLGIGMAFPVVVLSRFPQFLKWIPKPGAWMVTLKSVLGFVLLASVIWLIWVLELQRGSFAVMSFLLSCLFLSSGLFFFGQVQRRSRKSKLKILIAVFLIIVGLLIAWGGIQNSGLRQAPSGEESIHQEMGINWKNYSPELMKQLNEDGMPIFLDFTAAWCLTCQVNDRVTLNDSRVIKVFGEHQVVAVKADWTNNDPEITAALAGFGRKSIPLYVFYPGDGAAPIILPEIITPGIISDLFYVNRAK